MANEPSIAVQALSPGGQARAKQVWDYQRSLTRLSRKAHTSVRWGFLAVSVVAIAEAGALFRMMPLIRVVPVFIPVNSDNTLASTVSPLQVDPSVTMVSLKHSLPAIASALWQYVRLRESYSWPEAEYAWNVVSSMSTNDVREQFQKWYVYTNKQSPQATYGFNSAIRVSWADSKVEGDKFTVTFWRQMFTDGNAMSKAELWTCHLAFVEDYSVPLAQRLQFNASGLVVTNYPGCFPAGTKPGGLTPGGNQ